MVLEREDLRDIYSSEKNFRFKTKKCHRYSSIRRAVQIKRISPNITLKNKGNIDTRINKTIKGEYDAIILAVAGLKGLG